MISVEQPALIIRIHVEDSATGALLALRRAIAALPLRTDCDNEEN